MPIDWFTVGAQTINFLLLLWLLKRFLFQPILNGLDARERKINKILVDANASKEQAQKLQTELEQEQQQIELQRSVILSKINQEASTQRKQLFSTAQTAADDMLRKRLEALQKELRNLQHDLVQQSIKEVYATSRKVLQDLAGMDIEQCMLSRLINRLNAMEPEQYQELLAALKRSNYSLLVRSAFELDTQQQQAIQLCLQNKFAKQSTAPLKFTFSHTPELLNGIELNASGWKIAWSSHNYLATLEHKVSELSSSNLLSQQHPIADPNNV